jgi:1,2-diacylglycerol 3-alpha-glucosyltransferase
MKGKERKVAYFTPRKMAPYMVARFARLAQVYENLAVVNVLGEDAREWEVELGILRDRLVVVGAVPEELEAKGKCAAVINFLERRQPEALVLAGYRDPPQIAAARWAKRNGAVRILHADTWQGDRPRYWLKEFIKRRFFVEPYFEAAFVPGIRALQYINSLGIPENAIWRGLYVVDNDYFAQGAAAARQDQGELRTRLGLPEDYFLCVARLSPEKNLRRLLDAYSRYREWGGDWRLVIVGAGPQEKELKEFAASRGGAGVWFAGWGAYEALPAYYGLARCFILPSLSEPWGMVVNEAMACGLPVLVSRKCGCLPELCYRGVNGFDFDPLDVEGMAQLMFRVSGGGPDLEVMGQASRRLISNFTLDTWVKALTDCIEMTIRARR